jgi:hypothetical protein
MSFFKTLECRLSDKVELMEDFRNWLKTDAKTLKKSQNLTHKLQVLAGNNKLNRYLIYKKVDYYILNENKRYITERKQDNNWLKKFPFMSKSFAYKFENYMIEELSDDYVKSLKSMLGRDYSNKEEIQDHILTVINNYYVNNTVLEVEFSEDD